MTMIAIGKHTLPKRNLDTPDKYCAEINESNVLVVMHQGKAIQDTVELNNGIRILKEGDLLLKNGTKHKLKPGQCVNKEGAIEKEDP
jgi:hypothetical protein